MANFFTAPSVTAIRGRLLTFTKTPAGLGDRDSYRYLDDGLLLIRDGRIAAVGPADEVMPRLPPDTTVEHYPDGLILPGFIDTHIHFPQTQVIASYGAQLLDWLEKYTFVAEQKYADAGLAEINARFFFDELLRNGTTTAMIYGSVHPQSVEAIFAESARRGTAMIAGKAMMDRNAPVALRDTANSSYRDSKALIERWHGKSRQRYAVTPRFAITSSEAQLQAAGSLLNDYPDVYLQTHLSENLAEIAEVRRLFPGSRSYTDVYDRFGLLGPRSLFGHCLHLNEGEIQRLSESGSVAAFCPTSNLFIGSGLFDWAKLADPRRPVRLSLATDVGGGTSYSLLRTMGEAYKVLQLQCQSLPALTAFHQATRGNAEALGMEGEIGSLEVGRTADLTILDVKATPAMRHRHEACNGDLEEELFILMTMGDDRAVRATYIQGKCQHQRVEQTS
ncbi:guanine deaminase [Telmatospirillum siberiense]|uniref:Guanine deaminase n=1 Tax=Telmatospirillum siberiense TaxID=382514 RepID=A0A2N3PVH2_9PROT|nr:guanine deaminase [Telmatospirillum siberiense]PKU24406.1 guanine deaminase [Telmatospirillum siberiense]